MRISPVQLELYFLSKVAVTPREKPSLSSRPSNGAPINWDQVVLGSEVEFGWADGQGEDLRAFAMQLQLKVGPDQKAFPYEVDLGVIGYLTLVGEIPHAERENLAKINGAALLYGVLREILFGLTARFTSGPAVLPSVNFLDLKSPPQQVVAAASGPTAGSP